MAIPLPKMFSQEPGGGITYAMGGVNSLADNMLKTRIDSAKAQYAPYTEYSNALSKIAYSRMLPYQIQATLMSNPMVWMALKDNPDAQKAFMDNFKNSFPQGGNITGGINIPEPGQITGNSLLGRIWDTVTGKSGESSSSNALNQSGNPDSGYSYDANGNNVRATPEEVAAAGNSNAAPPEAQQQTGIPGTPAAQPDDSEITKATVAWQNSPEGQAQARKDGYFKIPDDATLINWYRNQQNQQPQTKPSPLVPALQGGMAGITSAQTAKYQETPFKPGTLIPDPNNPGGVISVPTGETTTAAQTSINAAQRVTPQLEELSDAAGPFLTVKGKVKEKYQALKNMFGIGKPGELPTELARFHSLLQSAPEALVKSYGLRPTNETIERMQKVIEPEYGETASQYKNRILKTLESIRKEQIGVSQKLMTEGFPVGPQKNSSGQQPMITIRNKKTGEILTVPANEARQKYGVK